MDTEGRLIRVVVHEADESDPAGGRHVLWLAHAQHPRLELVWADSRYEGSFVTWAEAQLGVTVEVVRPDPDQAGFVVQARRWVVERTFAWLMKCRRLVRDFEEWPDTTEAWIYLAMIKLYLRRLAQFAY